MITTVRTTLAFSLALISLSVWADDDFAPIDRLVEETRTTFSIPFGTAYAVVQGDRMVHEGYFGFADIAEEIRVAPDTAFYIASATKPFFALATLLEEHSGGISESSTLRTLFPGIHFGSLDPDSITVEDLLTHTSGIDPGPIQWATAYTGIHDDRLRHALIAAATPDPDAPSGTFFYSNVGYNILSVWFDDQAGGSWQDALRQSVFLPLGMVHTSAHMSDANRQDWTVARPYSNTGPDPASALYLEKRDNTMHAAGGMISTPRDLARFLIAQLNDGMWNGRRVFPQAVIEKSHSPQTPTDDDRGRTRAFTREAYAWGWFVGHYREHRLLHHSGGFPGASSHLSFLPDAGVGVVILNNEGRLGDSLNDIIADAVYRILLGLPDVETDMQKQLDRLVNGLNGYKAMLAREAEKRATWDWRLSLEKAAYAGSYRHPLLGPLHVSLSVDNQLFLEWGNLRSVATPDENIDAVRVRFIPESDETLEFQIEDGTVSTLRFRNMILVKSD